MRKGVTSLLRPDYNVLLCRKVSIWDLEGYTYLIKDTFGTSRFVLCREVVLFSEVFYLECVYMSTFSLSFVGRFVLFRSVLYQRFHCTVNTSQ